MSVAIDGADSVDKEKYADDVATPEDTSAHYHYSDWSYMDCLYCDT